MYKSRSKPSSSVFAPERSSLGGCFLMRKVFRREEVV